MHAVALLHDRGYEGVRIRANFYATGHWRCRIYVPQPGDDPALQRDVILSYTNGRAWDLFGDGRTGWDAGSLADALQELADAHPASRRADPEYVAWLREVRTRTGGGHLSMYEDVLSPEDDWEARRLVRLIPAPDAPPGERSIRLPPAP